MKNVDLALGSLASDHSCNNVVFFPTLLKAHLVWLRSNMHKVVRCTCYPGNRGYVPRWNRPERYYQSLHRYTVLKNDLMQVLDKEPKSSSVFHFSEMFTTKWFNIWSVQKIKSSMFKGILCQAGWRTPLCLQSQQVRNFIYLPLQGLLFLKHERFKKRYTCKSKNAFGSDPLHVRVVRFCCFCHMIYIDRNIFVMFRTSGR